VTVEYPTMDGVALDPSELRVMNARTVPYVDAQDDELIAVLIGSIEKATYTPRGTLDITFSVPFDIVGDPTALMRSQGRMLTVELRRRG
jgi:hypothetical protein